ncbi:Ada metal-binding domain-containing protein [Mucilaginibacter litoreus]|uniref:Ada metal-binding domain-containing protein n=1 Tax=Mucilaginibacter litoreus TaxID=1048221 RepID=A0ABW3AVJ1_9SPHI
MIRHTDLGAGTYSRAKALSLLLHTGAIQLAGNFKLKIYGALDCNSGKRMEAKNRVFFSEEGEAIDKGFRPCGHCMRTAYNEWKKLNHAGNKNLV